MSEKWTIWVGGYGGFEFEGTEEEAEEMRAHKSRWEGGIGRKYRSDPAQQTDVDRIEEKIIEIWDRGDGAPDSLFKKLRKAKEALKQ